MNELEVAAEYRNRCRPHIPGQLVVKLAEIAGQNTKEYNLLDVGSGEGNITEQFLPYFKNIIVVESDPESMKLAKDRLTPAVPADGSVLFVNGEVEDAKFPLLWQASLVTLFKMFHRVDQKRVLERLNNLVEAGGVIAILKDEDFWTNDSEWMGEIRQIVTAFLGDKEELKPSANDDTMQINALERSPFSNTELIKTPFRRVWSTDQILNFLYSTSFGNKQLFGDRIGEFEKIVRDRMSRFSPEDKLLEMNEYTTILARRP